MNGAQWLVRTLKERGVEQVFVLCGNGLPPFLDACLDVRLKTLDVRNEQSASFMADLYGRMTRRLGVCVVSSGPGHTNALTGLANAWWDGGPMLLLSGQSSNATRGADHFQELPQVELTAPICKYAARVEDVTALPGHLQRAATASLTGRPGPSHLTVPVDVLAAEMPDELARRHDRRPFAVTQRAEGDPGLVREAVDLLAAAKRPVAVVGSGAFYAGAAEAVKEFARATDIPLFSHLWDRGCLEQRLLQYVGVTNGELTGAYSLVEKADVILTLGARVDHRLGFGRPPVCARNVKFVRVDYDPNELSRGVEPVVGIAGDVRSVLGQLTRRWNRLGAVPHSAWLQRLRRARAKVLAQWAPRGGENVCPLAPPRLVREVQPFLDQDVTFLLDGGNIGRWAHLLLWDRHPSHWATCGASGVVGWGLPGAVAANLARPGEPVLLLAGDGASGFTIADIETALRFGTPYVAVIAHDAAWGIVADGEPEGRHVASLLGELRFDRVAQALGARGVYVDDPRKLGPAIEDGLSRATVTVIHVPTQRGGVSTWGRE